MGRSGTPLNAEARNRIMRMALAGVTKTQCAERMGLSVSTVSRYWPETKPHKHDERGPVLE